MARRYRLLAGVLLAAAVALIAPAPASALPNPTDLLPSLPSVGDILESILKKLVDLVVPKEVSKAWSKIVAWLVALPDPTSQAFRNLNGVRESLQASAVGLLSLSFTLAAFRYWAAGFSGDAGVASALRRCVLAIVALIAYPQAISTAIVGINTLTGKMGESPESVGMGLCGTGAATREPRIGRWGRPSARTSSPGASGASVHARARTGDQPPRDFRHGIESSVVAQRLDELVTRALGEQAGAPDAGRGCAPTDCLAIHKVSL